LCGEDRLTGQDFSHRRDWIETRVEQMAGLFAIEVSFQAIMSNHFHLVLRTRPRIAKRLGREEVARRWLTITALAKAMGDGVPEPDPERVKELAKDKKRIDKLRRRLSNISWFMGILCENIARRANREDDCKGRFWESRYGCRECTDENSVLVCGIYVDLNPIVAGEAKSPQTARYTSIYQRIQARQQRANAKDRADGWLAELTIRPGTEEDAVVSSSRTGRRASDWGLLPISLESYLKLLNWTARQLREGKRSTIPGDLEAVLDHLDVKSDAWLDTVEGYEDLFCHVIGPPAAMANAADRMGVRCLKGTPASKRVFA
jgi:hypothetical protein